MDSSLIFLVTDNCLSFAVTTFMLSALVGHENKLDMVHIQNSTLAGGVAVGSVCNLIIQPYGALTIGVLAGLLSVFGYRYLSVSGESMKLKSGLMSSDSPFSPSCCPSSV